jgi:spore cortex formation protein SpoVR/YcgB (stage V sporulation)
LQKTDDSNLYLVHHFENKQLIKDFIPDVLTGLEFLWGGQVQLETVEISKKRILKDLGNDYMYRKVIYSMKDRKIDKVKAEE